MAGLYFEEFTAGQAFEHPWTRTVTEMDNVLFSSLTMNVQPLHLDEEFASKTEFGQPIANLGMTDVRFPKPVFHGDTVRVRTRVLTLHESKSRPDAGLIEFEHTAT